MMSSRSLKRINEPLWRFMQQYLTYNQILLDSAICHSVKKGESMEKRIGVQQPMPLDVCGASGSRQTGHAFIEGKRRGVKHVILPMCAGRGQGLAGLSKV